MKTAELLSESILRTETKVRPVKTRKMKNVYIMALLPSSCANKLGKWQRRYETFELECHSSDPSISSASSVSGGTSTNTSWLMLPRQRGQRGFTAVVFITSSMHLRQKTWAQWVITGVESESRHTGHSSSAPELRRVTRVDTSFWRSSSGVEQPWGCNK